MKKKLLSMLLAVSLVGTMLMAGCGNKAADEPQTIDDIEAAPETPEGEEPGDTEGAGGGELADTQEMVFVLNNEPDGIDPNVTNNSFATPFLSNCFEGLVTYDEKGEVVPGNAESWESNDDLTVYTFHLRDGLKWNGSDGKRLCIFRTSRSDSGDNLSVCEYDFRLCGKRTGVL